MPLSISSPAWLPPADRRCAQGAFLDPNPKTRSRAVRWRQHPDMTPSFDRGLSKDRDHGNEGGVRVAAELSEDEAAWKERLLTAIDHVGGECSRVFPPDRFEIRRVEAGALLKLVDTNGEGKG